MRDRIHLHHLSVARLVVWAALSGALLYWLRRGSVLVGVTSYYHIRRSVPYVWNRFNEGLPEVGNARALDLVYWLCLVVMVIGVPVLFWLALDPTTIEAASSDPEPRPE